MGSAGRVRALTLALALFGLPAQLAWTQTYPNKTVRIIVPYPPGGGADTLARAVGQKLSEAWAQPVVTDNRPGAGGNIGSGIAAKSPPDGYTLLLATLGPMAINPALYEKPPYDSVRDFSHITELAKVPGIVVVHPSLPVRNVKELIAFARANPDKLRHASAGAGGPSHLGAELFKNVAGVRMIHVPYKGATPAITDVVAGHVEVYFGNVVSVVPQVKSGRLRALGITSMRRAAVVPDLPTLDEQGLKGFETGSWFGVSAPAGTAREIVARLHAEIVRIIALPDVRDRLGAEGAQFIGSTPEEFTQFVRAELAKWGNVVKTSGARAE